MNNSTDFKNKKVLIAIPTFNESLNITPLIDSILNKKLNKDILFIDDNSYDGTKEIIKKKKKLNTNINLIINPRKSGVGNAHLMAIKYAYDNKYDLLVTMDADFTHDPKYIKEIIQMNINCPLVTATRHVNKDSLNSWPKFRKFLTKAAYFFTKNFLKINFDATSGFRSYNLRKIDKNLFKDIKSKSYSFFVESSFKLNKSYQVKSLPIEMPIRFAEKSKMSKKDIFSIGIILLKLFFFGKS